MDTNNAMVCQESRATPYYLNLDIKHCRQLTKNDCGIACLKMAFNYLFKETSAPGKLDTVLGSLGLGTTSLWTIDIANVCAAMDIAHLMYTITWGVEESYGNEPFYAQEMDFDEEKRRVARLFEDSSRIGLKILKESVRLAFIKHELRRQDCVCIVLIDAALLNGVAVDEDDDNCRPMCDSSPLSSLGAVCCFGTSAASETDDTQDDAHELEKRVEAELADRTSHSKFLGHYIVTVGYDDLRQRILYRNPASSKKLCYTSYKCFEVARRTYGTDQDLIFIYTT